MSFGVEMYNFLELKYENAFKSPHLIQSIIDVSNGGSLTFEYKHHASCPTILVYVYV